jgi:hypothetical protein
MPFTGSACQAGDPTEGERSVVGMPSRTDMPTLSVTRRFAAAVLIASLLFTLVGANPAGHWPWPVAFVFWMLSVGIGLGLASAVAAVLVRQSRWLHRPRWLLIALAGGLGLLLYAPLSLALDGVFPPAPDPDDGDAWLDAVEASGLAGRLLAEVLQAGPAYLLTWGLINAAAPWQPARTPPAGEPAPGDAVDLAGADRMGPLHARTAPPSPPVPRPSQPLAPSQPPAPTPTPSPTAAATPSARPTAAQVLGWPPALGDEVIHVSADLHYLQVVTQAGRATVLGSMAAVELHFGEQGLRIHRSHWVSLSAVHGVRRTAAGWVCTMRDGRQLPVSRRRMADVRARLGRDFWRDGP